MPLSTFIRLKTQFEGLHHWPDAPEPEGYLRSPHRHLFVVEADIQVFHDDREIEINAASRWLETAIPRLAVGPDGTASAPVRGGPLNLGPRSCEQLAAGIAEAILDRYGRHRALRCAVLEDGILGAGVCWQPESAPVTPPPGAATGRPGPMAGPPAGR